MPKRLQVIIEDAEYGRIQSLARRAGLSLSEWVRQALRAAGRGRAEIPAEQKLAVIRKAAQHSFPSPDIEAMLDEIDAGHRQGKST